MLITKPVAAAKLENLVNAVKVYDRPPPVTKIKYDHRWAVLILVASMFHL